MTIPKRLFFVGLNLCAGLAAAGPVVVASAKVVDGSGFGRVVISLAAVLGVLMCTAWYAKKMGAQRQPLDAAVKIVGGVSVGKNEKVLVLEVADQWIVIGVGHGNIQALSTMPRKEGLAIPEAEESKPARGFNFWLAKEIDKRSKKNNEG